MPMRLNGRTSMPRHARASGMEDRARKNLVHPGKVREGGKEDLRESAGVFVVKEMENWRGETTHQNPHQNSLRLWQVSFGRETRDLVVPWPSWAGGIADEAFEYEFCSHARVSFVGRRQRTLANVPIRDEFRTHTSRADIRVSIGMMPDAKWRGGQRFSWFKVILTQRRVFDIPTVFEVLLIIMFRAVGASEAILKTGGRSGGATDKLGFPHRASLEIGGNPRAQPPSDPTSATRMLTSVCQERTIRTDSGQLTVRTGSGQRTLGTDSQRLAV
ncbi:hypothetical protein T492DRAFT_1139856 [Pavlovales sp. CCMP2436]|nr:hypothetical protein T492DRAFT_1139856 [Pavlovales sp. CCMP2436]